MSGCITQFDQVTASWLSQVLGVDIRCFEIATSESTWARAGKILATATNGDTFKLWLKICAGDTFGRSEVDYYTRDYVGLDPSPVVKCYDAEYEPGVGYHLLLEDHSDEFEDRKHIPPTLAHGFAIAESLAALHRHRWGSEDPPTATQIDHSLESVFAGIEPFERATGISVRQQIEYHAARMKERWTQPMGLTLLHGDPNPTNVLAPIGGDGPVYLLDRQPFEWSLTYGLAAYDLAYAMAPWWDFGFRTEHGTSILRHWYDHLGVVHYPWELAQADFELSIEQCLHVPVSWCGETDGADKMRWLWEWQYRNITGFSDPFPANGII